MKSLGDHLVHVPANAINLTTVPGEPAYGIPCDLCGATITVTVNDWLMLNGTGPNIRKHNRFHNAAIQAATGRTNGRSELRPR